MTRIQFIIGDVRDSDRLKWACMNVDIVVHAAATKIVPTAEYNPTECIKTNINGAMNVIEASLFNGVKKVVALSTDKASNPINLYGATKLASDKLLWRVTRTLTIKHNFCCKIWKRDGVQGSVIPFFIKLRDKGSLPITHLDMTRFMISLEEGVGLVWEAL